MGTTDFFLLFFTKARKITREMISVLPKPNFSLDDSISSVSTISDEPAPIRVLTREWRRKLRQNENFRGSNDFDSAVKRLTGLLRSDQLHILYVVCRLTENMLLFLKFFYCSRCHRDNFR